MVSCDVYSLERTCNESVMNLKWKNDMIKVASISRILEKVALILGKNQLAINALK